MHLADFEKGNYGTNMVSLVGGYALAVGACPTQIQKQADIVVSFSGFDGATNEGSFLESNNMA